MRPQVNWRLLRRDTPRFLRAAAAAGFSRFVATLMRKAGKSLSREDLENAVNIAREGGYTNCEEVLRDALA